MKVKEANLHQQVVDYIKWKYPKILFRTDFAAGIKMTIGQAMKHKKIQKCKAWPDLFIAHPIAGYNGLFIELKRDRSEVYLKSGCINSKPHIIEQHKVLCDLTVLGYRARFACGFDEATTIIDEYLKAA